MIDGSSFQALQQQQYLDQQKQMAQQQQALHELRMQNERNRGRPADMTFDSQLQSNGQLKDSLQQKSNLNTGYLDQMRQDNLRQPGQASAWRNLIDQKITNQAGQQNAALGQQQARQLDNIAMRGGASRGAAERMAQAGVGQGLAAQQNIFGKRLQADLADEQNRQSGLANLGNAEMGAAKYQSAIDQNNLAAGNQERFQQRAFNTNMYNQKMKAWASERTAAATPSGGGKK